MGLLPPPQTGGLSFPAKMAFSTARAPVPHQLYPLSPRNTARGIMPSGHKSQGKSARGSLTGKHHRQPLAVLNFTYKSRQQNPVSRDHYFEGTLPIPALLGRHAFYEPQMPTVKLNQSSERFQTLPCQGK